MSSRTVSISAQGSECMANSGNRRGAGILPGERGMIALRIKEREMREKPQVLAREIVASSRLFRVEELQLRFANGVERTYERLASKGSGYGAVMVVAMLDGEH